MKPHWMAPALMLLVSADIARGQTDAVICGGSDRWPIKTSADTSQSILDAAAAATPKTVDDVLSKPKPSWSPPKSQYQSKAIPGDEETTIRVRGWLYMIGHDPKDSDYHLQLVSDLNNCPDRSVIVEVPDDRCVVGANLVGRSSKSN